MTENDAGGLLPIFILSAQRERERCAWACERDRGV